MSGLLVVITITAIVVSNWFFWRAGIAKGRTLEQRKTAELVHSSAEALDALVRMSSRPRT